MLTSSRLYHHALPHRTKNNNMVRKHRNIQRQRQYQKRVISWWIKLSSPPIFLFFVLFLIGTRRTNLITTTTSTTTSTTTTKTTTTTLNDDDKVDSSNSSSSSAGAGGLLSRWWFRNQKDQNKSDNDQDKMKKPIRRGVWMKMMQNTSSICIANILDQRERDSSISAAAAVAAPSVTGIGQEEGGHVGEDLVADRTKLEMMMKESLVCLLYDDDTNTNDYDVRKDNNNNERTMIRSVWIAGSTAAAGYGNQKHQSYPAILQALLSSSSSSYRVSVDVGRDWSEFPLAWCRLTSPTTTMVVYDFQDDMHQFNTTRLKDFVTFVQPQVLVIRLSNDYEWTSQYNIVHYLQQSLLLLRQETTTTTKSTIRAIYIVDVSTSADTITTVDGSSGFGVANSPDALHAHHLTRAQHERVATILHLLMQYHGHRNEPNDGLPVQDNNVDKTSHHHHIPPTWNCASGFGDAMTTGRTPSSLHFVVNNSNDQDFATTTTTDAANHTITLGNVLPECCGNSMDSVLLPHKDLRHSNWLWDALDASAKRRGLPFDQYGHTDWKLVVSGTPQSKELKVVLPTKHSSSSDSSDVDNIVRHLRVCGDCEGMIVSADATLLLQPVGYGCFDVKPPTAAFSISVSQGTCQISHILWQ